jgi:hypothetical protein
MNKLKPCPFCGDVDGVKIEPYHNSYRQHDGYDVSCQNIHCIFQPSGWTKTEEEAIKEWNTRTPPDKE